MSKQELESKIFSQLDMLNTQNQLNIGGMVMALTMSTDPEYKKLNWVDMNNYAKAWIKKTYLKNGTGEKDEQESVSESSKKS